MRIFRNLTVAFGLLVALAVLWALARVMTYTQVDDPARVAAREEYLHRIAERRAAPGAPNVVLVLFDDLGPADVGALGSAAIRTPNLDELAQLGTVFENGYSSSPYCSASRAGLLTGRYAVRAGLDLVLQPGGTLPNWLLRLGGRNVRLPGEEITISEVLAAAGYDTAMIGKWHLGEGPSLPTRRGFDSFFGLLYSNDQGKPRVWRDEEVVEEHPIDQSTLTRRYTREATSVLGQRRGAPLFLYLAHTFPHVPLHSADPWSGRSAAGLYGDVVEELDWSVGQIVEAIGGANSGRPTLLLVTSDNGPWFQGSAGGLRGRKLDIFEGGMRVPFLAAWVGGDQPARRVAAPVMGIDLFPTLLELAALPPPTDRSLDGRSLVPLLAGSTSDTGRALYYFQLGKLQAMRVGRFKYHARHRVDFGNPMDWPLAAAVPRGPWLFDLDLDPDESYDASATHPEIAAAMRRQLEEARASFAENPRGWLDG